MAKIRMRQLLPVVADHYNVPPHEVLGRSKKLKYTKPRQVFYWLCRYKLEKSYSDIARFLNRDHTTIIYGARKCRENKWVSYALADELYEKASQGVENG